MPDVLLATDDEKPDLWEDERPLIDAIERTGLKVAPAVWDDPSVDWAASRLVVIRSLFDYTRKRDEFCAWADRVESLTSLHNPARVLGWNSHKSYLRELDDAGIPVVPTVWLDAGATPDLAGLLDGRGWREAVVKPAIDNGARGALRVSAADPGPGQSHMELLLENRDVMVQPFVPAAEVPGEHKMIHIAGVFTHAILENPRLDGRGFSLDRIPLIDPEPAELELAGRVLSLVPEAPLLYARVDTVMDGGVARLMELEVIEPVLFFTKAPGAAERMALAIAERLQR